MAASHITIRICMGDAEIEATGPKAWVEQQIAKFIRRRQAAARRAFRGACKEKPDG